jgi:hypothetical protein
MSERPASLGPAPPPTYRLRPALVDPVLTKALAA